MLMTTSIMTMTMTMTDDDNDEDDDDDDDDDDRPNIKQLCIVFVIVPGLRMIMTLNLWYHFESHPDSKSL
jgi:hypothetical protein